MEHNTYDTTISPDAIIGENVKIWHYAQVREKAIIGDNCIISRGAYIGVSVYVGKNCKIQNYACVYKGAQLEDGVFIGPHAVITNDKYPRAVTEDGELKTTDDWRVSRTTIEKGASIGTAAVIIGGITVGRWAMVGACSVVTHDVPPHAVVVGNPAHIIGYVDKTGRTVNTPKMRHIQGPGGKPIEVPADYNDLVLVKGEHGFDDILKIEQEYRGLVLERLDEVISNAYHNLTKDGIYIPPEPSDELEG